MESAVVNPRDLRFQLFEVLGADALCARTRYRDHDRESLEAALDLAIQIADEVLWPNAPIGDRDEPRLENGRVRVPAAIHESVAAITDAGFIAAALDYDRGGMQLPAVLLQACLGVLKAADTATAGYLMLTKAAANLLDVHGTDEQKRLYMEPLYAGRFMGTMCLSEPDVGSSLGDIRCRAVPAVDGSYRPLRQQDVDLRRRPGHLGEHRPPGSREAPRRAARREGNLALHRAQDSRKRRRLARHPQRCRRRRPQSQDGLPRDLQLPAELRRERRVRSAPGGRSPCGARLHVPHDERGADRGRHQRRHDRLCGLHAGGALRQGAAPGPAGR